MYENSFITSSSSPSEEKNESLSNGKKRRKQSNPTRYGNSSSGTSTCKKIRSGADQVSEDEELNLVSGDRNSRGSLSDEGAVTRDESDQEDEVEDEDGLRSCPHCPASFPSDDLFKAHIEEEHVLQLLERQIRQYQFGRNGGHPGIAHNGSLVRSSNNESPTGGVSEQQELVEQHFSMLLNQRPIRPASRTSSRSSSLSQPESPGTSHRTNRQMHESRHSQSHPRDNMDRESLVREFGNVLPFPLTAAGIPSGIGPDGRAIPISLFPPFLFPVLPSAQAAGSGPGTSGNVSGSPGNVNRSPGGSIPTGSGSFSIFNPEAYCELCNKEFCNKYFLRTHKANRHGIYSADPSTPVPNSNNSGSSGSSGGNNSNGLTVSNNTSPGPAAAATASGGTGGNTGGGLVQAVQAQAAVNAAAAAASAFFPAGLLQQSASVPVSTGDGQSQLSPQVSVAAMAARIVGSINQESYCEICQKEFCNKYFLKKHKQRIHGIQSEGQQQSGPMQTHSPNSLSPSRNPNPASTDHNPMPSPSHSPSILTNAVLQMQQQQQQAVNQTNGESGNGMDPFGSIGLKGFCNKYFSKNNKQKQHDVFDIQSVVNSIHKAAQSQSQSQQPQVTDNSPLKRSLSDSGSRSPTPGHTMPPATSPKNYCNICNKELCNKYFMKTHMLKMHGINIEEQPGEAAQASTIGGVTCDVCQKELCSKYFLKVHKQNTHGIYEESSGREGRGGSSRSSGGTSASGIPSASSAGPVSDLLTIEMHGSEKNSPGARGIDPKDTSNRYFSHYTEVCPYCQRRFKSIKWLRTHLDNDHSDLQSVRSQIESQQQQTQQLLLSGLTLPPPAPPQSMPPVMQDNSENSDRGLSPSGKTDNRVTCPRSGSSPTSSSCETQQAAGGTSVDHRPSDRENNVANVDRSLDPHGMENRYFNDNTEVCPLCQRRFESLALLQCKKQMLMIFKHLERFLRE